jgi:hypothetical protein
MGCQDRQLFLPHPQRLCGVNRLSTTRDPLACLPGQGVFVSPDQEREHAASAMMRGWCAFERMLHDWFDTRKNTVYNVSVCILFYPVEEVCSTTRSLFLPEKEAQLAHCGW